MSKRPVIERLRERVLEGLAFPVKARVDRSYIKKSAGGYCIDAEVVNPATLEGTGELLKEIPLSPLWMAKDGRGLFVAPESGQLLVIGFVDANRAYPYVAGFAGDEYTPADGEEGAFVLTDGAGAKISLSGSLFGILNKQQSLKTLIESFIDEVMALQTFGPPPKHTLSPDSVAKLVALKAQVGLLFKE